MKITVFTSNQPRHLALIRRLASVSNLTYAIVESNTVFPGRIGDFYRKTEVMQSYLSRVLDAERKLFGGLSFMPSNVRSLLLKDGDLNFIDQKTLADALNSDVYVVFGASYIKGWLSDFLVSQSAINIHMGISPFYRGSSCNFWALYDNNPQYVGATIHMLSKGLDSGPMLYHALPKCEGDSPFEFSMRAVESAQKSLVDRIASKEIWNYVPTEQDRSLEIRYTKNSDFTDMVANEFLNRNLDGNILRFQLAAHPAPSLLRPYYS